MEPSSENNAGTITQSSTEENTSNGQEYRDFRPPWLYSGVSWAQWTVVPAIAIYGVFFMDFGESEHCFTPARRWLRHKRATFLTLSDEELALAQDSQSR